MLLLSFSAYSQLTSFSLQTGAGYTIVDIEKAIDETDLEDWDNIALMFKGSVEYGLKNGLSLVGEIGSNRLYYWEYFWSDGFYSGYRYRAEWTTNFGVQIKKRMGNKAFILAGPGLHIFNDGSGVVPAIVASGGINIPLGGKLSLPVMLRIESVFGNSVPTSLILGTGLTYLFRSE